MPPHEEFPTKGLEGAPSNDIGWHFGTPVPNTKGNIVCKLCGKVVKGGITRFKEHIAHKTGNVAPCPNVAEDEDEHEEFIDEVSAIRQATRESIQSQHEWHRREEFRQSTGGWNNIYEEGRSSHGSAREYHRERTSKSIPSESEFTLRGAIPELARSKSSKQPKSQSINEFVIGKGTIFWKSVDVSSVRSRDVEFYYSLLDSVVEEIGENYIDQIVTDNEATMKAAGKKLMLKRKHLYWTSCAAHCLDLCLEDIGKKPSVTKVLDEAKKVTCFTYNHIWTVDLMKKYTQGKQILRPALTRFAAHFIQLEEITRQKQGLREMFNSKEFKESKWGQPKSGPAYEVKKIVLGKDFWKKANDLIKVYEPLVKVLRLVDSDEKPTMGFIYEAVDRAKRAIQQDCRYFTEYEKLLTIDGILYIPTCIQLLLLFRDKHETFGTPQAQRAWKQMNPDVDPLSEWLNEKENPLLDGENDGVLPVDTSDDEMDSGDGPNGGGLSPIDEDDGYSGDRGEIRSSRQYGGEYEVGTTSGHFRDRSEIDGNMFPEPRRDRSEPRAPLKGKGKKHTSIGSSSGRRSSSSNLGYSDSSTSTQGFYPPEQPSYFQPLHGYPQPYGYFPPFPNYGVPYQPQMHPPPPMYHPPPPLMYPLPQIYPPYQLYENQGENVTFFGYIFGKRSRESSQERSQSEGEGSNLPRHSTNW
ncbi:hypothetical protein CXB51_019483 [Gossypium anomalum]|uniref:BED-type domain-containing protein n=1 Tax=Gossypium anomalum TaxID=47600 RepID=A0A8J6CVI5_9ROSI|nr:hypothetical protein CXB51_019483 [Gossypium anomalum]